MTQQEIKNLKYLKTSHILLRSYCKLVLSEIKCTKIIKLETGPKNLTGLFDKRGSLGD